ncbi:MAG: TerB family tellurite resistance protein [Polyangiaceae bacterium]|nr:TerB family tellurite resistance protein [Polyangiaceae bacterium]MCW5790207.1 TerB family tellurite resistance protein [Polyangiaceae bacterium]
MDEAERRRVCQLIAGIVVADDDLDDAEEAFITKMLLKFGIPLEEREVIFPIISADEASVAILSLPAAAQEEAFQHLVEAACADGTVAPEEREYLTRVAGVLGVSDLDARLEAQLNVG